MAMKPTLKLNTLYIYLINDTFVYVLIKIYTCDMVINICTMENVGFFSFNTNGRGITLICNFIVKLDRMVILAVERFPIFWIYTEAIFY